MELSRLRSDVARLKRENEITKKSGGVHRAGCSLKYAWIGAHIKASALIEMCVVLDVSVSGYRAWKRAARLIAGG
jgi:hypothetical protein